MSTKEAALFVLISDRDFKNEIHNFFCPSSLSWGVWSYTFLAVFLLKNPVFLSSHRLTDIPVEVTSTAWSWIMLCNWEITTTLAKTVLVFATQNKRGTQRQFSENICSEDDLRSRIFGRFVVKFLACLPLLRFSNSLKNGIIAHF